MSYDWTSIFRRLLSHERQVIGAGCIGRAIYAAARMRTPNPSDGEDGRHG